jgi:hypothetical protein
MLPFSVQVKLSVVLSPTPESIQKKPLPVEYGAMFTYVDKMCTGAVALES